MAVGHAGRPDPATARRSVPSAWPGSWAGGADSSGPTRLSTSIFHFPVETGHSDARSGGRDGRRTCRPAGLRTARRSVPSAWPGSWAGGADSSGPTRLSTGIFHFPVETGHSDARSGGLANRMSRCAHRVRVARSRVRVRPMERLFWKAVSLPTGTPRGQGPLWPEGRRRARE